MKKNSNILKKLSFLNNISLDQNQLSNQNSELVRLRKVACNDLANITNIDKDKWHWIRLDNLCNHYSYLLNDLSADTNQCINHFFDKFYNTKTQGITIINGNEIIDNDLPKGVELIAINSLTKEDLSDFFYDNKCIFSCSNQSVLEYGYLLKINKDFKNNDRIMLTWLFDSKNNNTYTYPKFVIKIADGVQANIIENKIDNPNNNNDCLVNFVSNVIIGNNANINHTIIRDNCANNQYVCSTQIIIQAESNYNRFTFINGSKLFADNIKVDLNGSKANANINGIYITKQNHCLNNYIIINHNAELCSSNQYYRGIANNNGINNLQGIINIKKYSRKSFAQQLHQGLLLSNKAKINAKPELIIKNDDVKCSHGNAIGNLDQKALLYLLSRGLDHDSANSLLIYSFLLKIINELYDDYMHNILDKIINKLEY